MSEAKKESVFMHIPRTAGGSMRVFCNNKGIHIIDHDLRNPNYIHLADYVKTVESQPFIFTFVRNPWERVLSAFQYLNAGGNNPADDADRKKYLEKYDENFDLFVRKAFRWRRIFRQLHFKPQLFWITDWQNNLIPNYLGRFENLKTDLNEICKQLETEPEELIHKNVSKHADYREFYTEKSRRIIEKAYQSDIRTFNYEF